MATPALPAAVQSTLAFRYPGILLLRNVMARGGRRTIGSVSLDVHTMMYALMLVIIGVQASTFGVFAKIIAIREKLLPPDPKMDRFLSYFSLEAGLVRGVFGVFLRSVSTL